MLPNGHEVRGSVVSREGGLIQTHKLYKSSDSIKRIRNSGIVTASASGSTGNFKRPVDISWLPAASKTYNISDDPRDYLITEIPALTGEIPNKNLQQFSHSELLYFDPMHGRQIYKTFIGSGAHYEHQNKEPLKAKGVIFDAVAIYIPRYRVLKINLLTGWDRTKDRDLVKDIESGERDGYSMGSIVKQFLCSITGQPVTPAGGKYKRGQIVETREGMKLCFHHCTQSFFFEISSVATPADVSAIGDNMGYFNLEV
jgi:hypothetical protein